MSEVNKTPSLEELLILQEADELGHLVTEDELDFSRPDPDPAPKTPSVKTPFDDGVEPNEDDDATDLSEPDDVLEDDDPQPAEPAPTTPTTPKEPKSSPNSSGEGEEDNEQLEAYYNFLKAQGLLFTNEDFEFDKTPESLQNAFEQTRENLTKNAFDQLWNRIHPDFQDALRYALAGGQSIQDFTRSISSGDIDYAKYDLSDEDKQRNIVREYYRKTTKHDDKRIDRMLSRLEEYGELLEEAEDALEYLKTNSKEEREQFLKSQEKQAEERRQQAEEWRNSVATAIKSSESIKGTRKGSVQAFLFNPIERGGQVDTDFNRRLLALQQNPEHYAQFADIIFDYDPTKGFSFDRFEKQGASKATSKFQKELEESIGAIGGKARSSKPASDKTPEFNWEKLLKGLDG